MPIPFSLSLLSRTFFKTMSHLLCERVIPLVHKIILLTSCSQKCQGKFFWGEAQMKVQRGLAKGEKSQEMVSFK